ncbi:alpha-1,3-Fucosyl transferase [Helicobacter pylori 908]|nr:alpha-1,3-Fucosyl transferase [Helicobacter pylori 908]
MNVCDFKNFDEAIDYVRYLHTHPNAYLDMLYENPLNEIDGKAYFYQNLSFKKILDFFKTILENDTIYHNNPFIFYRDLNEPLVAIDDLRVNYLRVNYDRLLQNASPLLELSQNTTFKIYRKAYQKSLPLLRAVRRWVKKMGL